MNTPLITIGEWRVERHPNMPNSSGICHIPCDSWMFMSVSGRVCITNTCRTRIPDDIFGVWLIHNFDNLGEIL